MILSGVLSEESETMYRSLNFISLHLFLPVFSIYSHAAKCQYFSFSCITLLYLSQRVVRGTTRHFNMKYLYIVYTTCVQHQIYFYKHK